MIKEAWLGLHESPETAIRCVVRSDTDGVLTAIVNGAIYPGETLEVAGNAFTGKVDIGGLSAGQTYTVDLAIDGVVLDTLTTKTHGGSVWSFLAASCLNYDRGFPLGEYFQDSGAAFVCVCGDFTYIESPATTSGSNPGTKAMFDSITLRSISWYSDDLGSEPTDAQFLQAYHDHYRVSFDNIKNLPRKIPLLQTTDDHTYTGNDGAANAGNEGETGGNYYRGDGNAAGAFCTTQAMVDKHWQFGIDVYRQWAKGNPVSSDVGTRTAVASPRVNAEKLYYDFVVGSVHFIVLECLAFRDTPDVDVVDELTAERNGKAANDITKRFLDMSALDPAQAQMDWLELTLKNSTSTFKCIISSKETIGQLDAWNKYDTDRVRLLAYLLESVSGNSDGWAVPGGVFAVSGDVHVSALLYDVTNKHLQARASPSAQGIGSTVNDSDSVYYDAAFQQNVIVKVDVIDDVSVTVKLIGNGARLLASKTVLAGENSVTEPVLTVGI